VHTKLRTPIGMLSIVALTVLLSSCGLFAPTAGSVDTSFAPESIIVKSDATVTTLVATFTVRAGATAGTLNGYTVQYLTAAGDPILAGASTVESDGVGLRLPRGAACGTFQACSPSDLLYATSDALPLGPMPASIAAEFVAGGHVSGQALYTWTATNDNGFPLEWTSTVPIVEGP